MADTIYWINSAWWDLSIRSAPLAGGGTVDTLYSGSSDGVTAATMPHGLAIDAAKGQIYWTNRFDNTIRRAPLVHGAVETLYDNGDGVNGPAGIAIHPAAGRIYWANLGDNTIRRAPLVPHGPVETLYSGSSEKVNNPTGVAIDPAAGRIYWANTGPDNTIWVAPLAPHGNVQPLYGPQGLSNPWWVAIDPAAGRIYWTHWLSAVDGRIRVAPLAGGGNIDDLYDSTTAARGVSYPGGLAIDPNPAEPGPERLEVVLDTERASARGWLGGALDRFRDLFPRPTPSPGVIYWGNGVVGGGGFSQPPPNPNNNTIQRGPLTGGTFDTLYRSPPAGAGSVAGPAGLALLRAPIGTAPPTIGWQFVFSSGPVPGQPPFGPPAPDYHVEQRLACSQGTWAPDLLGSFLYRAPQSFTYQWIQNGTDLTGYPDPTKRDYTPTVPGSYRCRVTATNRAGSATQTSAPFTVTSSMLPNP